MLGRLHAVSSRNMYSEQGFDPFIRHARARVPLVDSCIKLHPRITHTQAVYAVSHRAFVHSPAGLRLPSLGFNRLQPVLNRAPLLSILDRAHEGVWDPDRLLLFCPDTVAYASPCQSVSKTSNSSPFQPCSARSSILWICDWGRISDCSDHCLSQTQVSLLIESALVISMLPNRFHNLVRFWRMGFQLQGQHFFPQTASNQCTPRCLDGLDPRSPSLPPFLWCLLT